MQQRLLCAVLCCEAVHSTEIFVCYGWQDKLWSGWPAGRPAEWERMDAQLAVPFCRRLGELSLAVSFSSPVTFVRRTSASR
ncbi:hypothetical protein GUJ93_ZPchr0006g46257 [Zizania palustris]|uniref:Uncharacterized protein n=1 Tax=Zizania palustris TaxID=103762 RepID=A0A8J5VMM8_ZIZPA|nr:hypothetical protein GUJ93_ZPchr0006g46257 [Zizania palustris]